MIASRRIAAQMRQDKAPMPLPNGTRLGPYEIQSALGVGGMGEVYRARDTRLGRLVALKISHRDETAVVSPETRQRFEFEARAISALAHPHICALFDVGSEAGVDFLVMELLEGETLASRLANGPLPLDEALRIAQQIAAALDAAHRRGIVHRDLKPANVMLTKAGAKLLDFGLARLSPRAFDGNLARSRGNTHALPLTGAGMIIGTLHYMAPEQLEGRPIDHRADLFAFGAVLYEMIAGVRAFEGTSPVSVMSAILRDRPTPIGERAQHLPAALERLIDACLVKDPEERRQSAHDLRLELAGLATEALASGSRAAAGPRRLGVGVVAAIATILAGLSVGVWLAFGRGAPVSPSPVVRFALPPPPGTAFSFGGESSTLAVSPDGRQIAFISDSLIWLYPLEQGTTRRLEGTAGARGLFWSPNGAELGFFAEGKLKRLSVAGGSPVTVCEVPNAGAGVSGTWGQDFIVYASVVGDGLLRVAATGGTPERFLEPEVAKGESRLLWPYFLPDGEALLYLSLNFAEEALLMRWSPGTDKRVVGGISSRVEYVDPGYLVFANEGTLLAQRFDAAAGRLLDSPLAIAPLVRQFRSTRWAAFATSRSGTIVHATATDVAHLSWFDPAGEATAAVGTPGDLLSVRLARSASSALVDRMRPGFGSYDLWLLDLERGVETRVTSDPGSEFSGLFLPDEQRIVYSASRGRSPHLYLRNLVSDSDQLLLAEASFQVAEGVSPDGDTLLIRRRTAQKGFDLALLAIGAGADATPIALLPATANVSAAALSPDGKLIAYLSRESGSLEAYLMPRDRSARPLRVSTAGAKQIAFGAQGGELLFVSSDNVLWSVAIRTTPTLAVLAQQRRFAIPGLGWVDFEVAADGRFLAVVRDVDGRTESLSVTVGWAPPTT
jgi:eukaryotic-like serine/threonine-protein kinase